MVTPLQHFVDHDFISLLSKPYWLYFKGYDSDRDDDGDDDDSDGDDDHDDNNSDCDNNNDGDTHVTHFIDDVS